MTEYVCNYALMRFLPYRDSGEFVNVGVALACGGSGYLDFRIEAQRWARVTHFFPELDTQVYRAGLQGLRIELERWQEAANQLPNMRLEQREAILKHMFGELTRPKEGIFFFAEPRTILTTFPERTLNELFQSHVHGKFSTESTSRQQQLQHQIAESLRHFKLARHFKSGRIGSPDYYIHLPFIAGPLSKGLNNFIVDENSTEIMREPALKAITPLDLDKEEPSEITQRGDEWITRIKRIDAVEKRPRDWLFVIRQPNGTNRAQKAATDISKELLDMGVETADGEDTASLLEFARFTNLSN